MLAGGHFDRANKAKIILHHPNGEMEIASPGSTVKQPGDEILIPPKVDRKYHQLAIDYLEIIYQIVISAKVAVDL